VYAHDIRDVATDLQATTLTQLSLGCEIRDHRIDHLRRWNDVARLHRDTRPLSVEGVRKHQRGD
jgi:hypothetical protein